MRLLRSPLARFQAAERCHSAVARATLSWRQWQVRLQNDGAGCFAVKDLGRALALPADAAASSGKGSSKAGKASAKAGGKAGKRGRSRRSASELRHTDPELQSVIDLLAETLAADGREGLTAAQLAGSDVALVTLPARCGIFCAALRRVGTRLRRFALLSAPARSRPGAVMAELRG